ncbi:MAG: TIGR03790 family protein [bacterium]|nr:TIGR03790 family protein [bacterium]
MGNWAVLILCCALASPALAIDDPDDPTERTADMPDSWLVLYNLNNPDSITWAIWYAQRRSIPWSNLVGLDASSNEHLTNNAALQGQIINPVRNLLESGDPPRKDSIMGIILGYGLPGHYGTPLQSPGVGGFSVTDALQDMTDDHLPLGILDVDGTNTAGQLDYNLDCPAIYGLTLPSAGRLNRDSMADDRYMVARIDAPTLEDAQQMTLRAIDLELPYRSLSGESVWYDYYAPGVGLTNDQWAQLRLAVEAPELGSLPWVEFEADTDLIHSDAFRFSVYRLVGWQDGWYDSAPPGPGSRVLAYDHSSWGATTVRSTTDDGGRSVPNALAGGYAASIGATGEPGGGWRPLPKVLLAALQEGWTLGESSYLSNPTDDWMWNLVGDPFLTLPNWFDEVIIDPSERTADMPSSWLVLYNLNDPESVEWADWYIEQRDIPAENLLGLDASLDEHLPDLAAVQAQIITPVRDLLTGDPEFESAIMGIVLGYGLPGHYAEPLVNPETGGFSVTDALQDMFDDHLDPGYDFNGGQRNYNYLCPTLAGRLLPEDEERLTKADLTGSDVTSNSYMVTRIDAPSLAEAKALTLRAKVLEDPDYVLAGEAVWYDYYDPQFPSGNNEWSWLRTAVEHPDLADVPWSPFEFTSDETPQDAFRMAVYQLTGWSPADFECGDPGSRVLAFDFNDWGAVSVRDATTNGGLYVPNALSAGYAAVVGATGKPACCAGPMPQVMMAALGEGWNLGEAYFLSNPYNDWMWTLVGDPFLNVPSWFDAEPLQGDLNGDKMVNLQDAAGIRACMRVSGPGRPVDAVCDPFDADTDGDTDLADFAAFQRSFTGGPVLPRTGDTDGNGEIDLVDFEVLQGCHTGVGPRVLEAECEVLDFDFDLSINLHDFSTVQKRFTGD